MWQYAPHGSFGQNRALNPDMPIGSGSADYHVAVRVAQLRLFLPPVLVACREVVANPFPHRYGPWSCPECTLLNLGHGHLSPDFGI